jgi:hypothetical protein
MKYRNACGILYRLPCFTVLYDVLPMKPGDSSCLLSQLRHVTMNSEQMHGFGRRLFNETVSTVNVSNVMSGRCYRINSKDRAEIKVFW